MKTLIRIALLVAWVTPNLFAQGVIYFRNLTTPTHIGAPDGPLAGPGIWAQLLAGVDSDSLVPVGMPVDHRTNGIVQRGENDGLVTVPFIPCRSWSYVQMVAWDGTLWGTTLAAVPPDQLGRTDTIPHFLACSFDPPFAPWFMQSAIVPVPEPSPLALGALAVALAIVWRRVRGRVAASRRSPPP